MPEHEDRKSYLIVREAVNSPKPATRVTLQSTSAHCTQADVVYSDYRLEFATDEAFPSILATLYNYVERDY